MAQVLDLSEVEGFSGELLRDGDPGYDDARVSSTPASTEGRR
jgi:hypothetical protein